MTKTDFLKEAMSKYKKAIAKEWVSEMNFIYSPQLVLRVWFDTETQSKAYAQQEIGETGYMSRWCTVVDIADETIFNKMDEFLCEDSEDFPLILLALKKALKKDKSKMIDHIEYKRGESITPIENFEFTFTVEAFCEAVGIEG
jgi:hypothetical protein